MVISKTEAVELIKETKGTFFSVEFVKRTTNEFRKMTCRLGVKKYLKGGVLAYNPSEYNLLGVFDINNGYRMINLDTLSKLKVSHKEYQVA